MLLKCFIFAFPGVHFLSKTLSADQCSDTGHRQKFLISWVIKMQTKMWLLVDVSPICFLFYFLQIESVLFWYWFSNYTSKFFFGQGVRAEVEYWLGITFICEFFVIETVATVVFRFNAMSNHPHWPGKRFIWRWERLFIVFSSFIFPTLYIIMDYIGFMYILENVLHIFVNLVNLV